MVWINLIHKPQKVPIIDRQSRTALARRALRWIDGEGIQQIIKFRDPPVTLPPPRESPSGGKKPREEPASRDSMNGRGE